MLSHEEMVGLQAESHELIEEEKIRTKEEYVLHLIHTAAYEQASNLAENKKVLDLGCNTGYGSNIISKSCKEIVGVDVSPKAISIASVRYTRSGIKFLLIDGKRLPFSDNSFYLIVSFQVIEHIVNYNDYISEIKRVLAPGGIVLFTTPNALIRLDTGMKPWNPFHVREFDATGLENLLSDFFQEVIVYGLFAKEPLYSIEYNRLNHAREMQRKRKKKIYNLYYSGRSLVKKFLPDKVVKKLLDIRAKNKGNKLDADFQNRYKTDSLFYSDSNLGNTLDLLAVCSDDKKNFEISIKNIKTKN